MKKFWAVIVLAAVAAALLLVLRPKNPAAQNPTAPNEVAEENISNASRPPMVLSNGAPAAVIAGGSAPNDLASRAASPTPNPDSAAGTNEAPVLPPLTVLDHARVVMHDYRDAFGEDPVGNNAEITAALMGKNPKQVNFIASQSGLRLNDKGEMLDGYGTPFFFHQISGKEMEIRSAGPDHVMWTPDDLVTR